MVDFVIVINGDCMAGIVTTREFTTGIGEPPGGVPVTEALLTMLPESRSAWVTTCVAVQVVDPPGASDVAGQVMPVALGSLTVIELSVVAPVFFTRNE